MSIELSSEAEGRVLIVRLAGKIVAEDYRHFGPEVDRAVEQHGKIRMLVDMQDLRGWTAGAIWQDLKFDARHFTHIDRLAMVGDKKWQEWMAVVCRPFTTATIRYFPREEMEHALAWLMAPTAPPTHEHG